MSTSPYHKGSDNGFVVASPKVAATSTEESYLSDSSSEDDDEDQLPVFRRIILVTLAMFSGYAALVTLQVKVKAKMGISNKGEDNDLFTVAVSCQYIGNLIFRIAHNFIFASFSPYTRVYISMGSMICSMAVIVFAIFLAESKWLGFVFIAYSLGGVAIGSFESNLINVITPLGHQTKVWAILGLPLGFTIISVVGFLLTQVGTPVVCLYIYVGVSNFLALFIFQATVPYQSGMFTYAPLDNDVGRPTIAIDDLNNNESRSVGRDGIVDDQEPDALAGGTYFAEFKQNIYDHALWFNEVFPYALALLGNMFMVSLWSALTLYIFNDSGPNAKVPMFGEGNDSWLMSHDLFISINNIFIFFGDSISRKVAYWMPVYGRNVNDSHRKMLRTAPGGKTFASSTSSVNETRGAHGDDGSLYPFWFRSRLLWWLAISLIGALLVKTKMGILAPLGMFSIFFANGGIYATTTRHIDRAVDKRFSLISLSVWLFIGDIGSVTGSNLVQVIRGLVCPTQGVYTCKVSN